MAATLSLIGIILSLILIIVLAFKKVNIILVSIIAAILLAILDGQNIITSLTGSFMEGAANYVKNYFLLFCLSALFGQVMEKTGAAAAIAKGLSRLFGEKFAILGVIFAGMLLAYGGISALVIAFTMYPLALAVFKRANLPRYLIPGAIAAGCFTFACSAFPGTPQTMNVVPTSYIGTTVNAAPVLGIICGVIGTVLTCLYMYYESARARKKGFGFEADEATMEKLKEADQMGAGINPIVAVLPILLIAFLLIVINTHVLVAMLAGTVLAAILFHKNLKKPDTKVMFEGAIQNGMVAVVTTGCIVGYGSVVSASTGYEVLSSALMNLNAPPLASFAIATAVLAGAAGSGTGGLGITMATMAQTYLDLGLSAEVLHRVGCLAAIGLDSLPHNGAVVVLLTLCGMTHKDSYKQIFVSTVVITLIVAAIAVVLGTIMYPIS